MTASNALLPFLPMEVRHALASGAELEPRATGAALFADLSGFTALSATFARALGPSEGAEALTAQLESAFEALIHPVHSHRGCVTAFSGDAVTCWFDDAAGAASGVRRALAAAMDMKARIAALPEARLPGGALLSIGVRFGLGSGAAKRVIVGAPDDQRFELIVGQAVDRMAAAFEQAAPGEIVVSEECLAAAGDARRVRSWYTQANGQRLAVLTDLRDGLAPEPWPSSPSVPPNALGGWLHPTVAERIRRGEGTFLNGFRPVVALFFQFGGLDYDGDPAAPSKLDEVVRGCQRIVGALGGQLIDVNVGDKGSYLFAAFGALTVHEDEPRRAVGAAQALLQLPFVAHARIGVSRGDMYVGTYGCAARRTFGVVASEVNVAARLMSVAAEGCVVVTPRVASAAASHFEFIALPDQSLKGFDAPITPYRLVASRSASVAPPLASPSLFGRNTEKAALETALGALTRGEGGRWLIEGEAGIGKSGLVAWTLDRARSLGLSVAFGASDGMLRGAPYQAWRPILSGLLAAAPSANAIEPDIIRPALAELGVDTLELGPLLNPVFDWKLEQTERTRDMTPDVRAQNTRRILVELVLRSVRKTPLVIVLEDLHWLDSSSAALLRDLSRCDAPLLVLATQRPWLANPESEALEDELWGVRTTRLTLGPLEAEEIDALIGERLGVRSLPPSLSKFVQQSAQGSPFFSQEITFALRDRGLIRVTTDSECQLVWGPRSLEELDLPDSVQAVITSRIDVLPAAQRLALKVASVLGGRFDARVLYDIHPVAEDKAGLDAVLQQLVGANLLVPSTHPASTHAFRHALTHEVAYGLLLRKQRVELHGDVLRWYEDRTPADDRTRLRVLAHHAARSVDAEGPNAEATTARAVRYLDESSEQALTDYANEEALGLLDEALRLDGPRTPPNSLPLPTSAAFRRAVWHERAARANAALGDLHASRLASQASLAMLAHPLPAAPWWMVVGIIAAFIQQVLRRILGERLARPVNDARRPGLEHVNAVRWLLAKALFHENDPLRPLYLNLKNLNLAEKLGASADLSIAYSVMQMTTAVLRMRSASESYAERALAMARRCGRPVDVGTVLFNDGICRLGAGEWSRAARSLSEARELARTSRYDQLLEEASAVEADAALLQGDHTRALELYHQVYQTAKQRNSLLHMGWCMRPSVAVALRAGRWDEVVTLVREGAALRTQVADPLTEIDALGMLSLALLRRGDPDGASSLLRQVSGLARASSPPVAYPRLLGLAASCEASIDLLEQSYDVGPLDARKREFSRTAAQLCAALEAYASAFVIGVPLACIHRGRLLVVKGRTKQALRAFRRSLATATRLRMPYEVGVAHLFIARHSTEPSGERLSHVDAALGNLQRVEAHFLYSVALGLASSLHADIASERLVAS